MSALGWTLLGFAMGAGSAALWIRLRGSSSVEQTEAPLSSPSEVARPAPTPQHPEPEAEVAPPHLIGLIVQALRDPLRELRRSDSAPEALAKLERLLWQIRMVSARPRPMRSVPSAPLALLQAAAEEVPLLRDGRVGASWSILNRQPAHVDPERMRAVFRELLACGAEIAGSKGRMGIKILPGLEPDFPVQIEIEIGRRGTEVDPLVLLATRHVVETQGGRLELDGNVTRIHLRNCAPEPVASVA